MVEAWIIFVVTVVVVTLISVGTWQLFVHKPWETKPTPTPKCKVDTDCKTTGETCGTDGKCVAPPAGCTKPEDCATGQTCGTDGKCVAKVVVAQPVNLTWTESVACEGTYSKVSCPDGKTLVIKDAMYGRTDKTTCPNPAADSNTNCLASPAKMQKFLDEAQGKPGIEIRVSNDYLGEDPCGGTTKYTKFSYACVAENERAIGCTPECGAAPEFCIGGRCMNSLYVPTVAAP
jgi:hypothetical protein